MTARLTPTDLAASHKRACTVDRPWSSVEFAELLTQKGIILCGDHNSFVLGRVTCDEAEVLTVVTIPDQQRKGLARRALRRFCTAAQQAGAVTAFLEVAADNAPALTLYRSEGFATVGQRRAYYIRNAQPPADALVLRRGLSQAASPEI